MMIAGKLEEIYPPTAKEWVYLTQETYTIKQINQMEQLLLKVLRFEMQSPTTHTFIEQFCADHDLDEKTKCLAMVNLIKSYLEENVNSF